ncbi:MAG: GNAT family N-acetyltransferase [Fimbriimonadaceae bacterium]|nr:GNAT family N-acetyltransferase [Fimbriimonadaceae bacterium]
MAWRVVELPAVEQLQAERLAAMWTASADAWPGGLNHGEPESATNVYERHRRMQRLAVFVVEQGDEYLGYALLQQPAGSPEQAYLALLNARPDYHGQGLGKALILACLERAVGLQKQVLTLGTWAGNLKAVPLYKKCGFCWVPETQVWMQNFLPLILRLPAAQGFLQRHPWYAAFERDLAVAPDDLRDGPRRVFPYRFRAGDELLEVVIDQLAEAPCSLTVDGLTGACRLGVEDVLLGVPQPLVWEVTNRSGRPRQISVLAAPSDGVALAVAETATVEQQWRLESHLLLDPLVAPRPPGAPLPQARSTVLVDGQPWTLAVGLSGQPPVELRLREQQVVPGRGGQQLVVSLRNRLPAAVTGELRLDPRAGLTCETLRALPALPAKGQAELLLPVALEHCETVIPTAQLALRSDALDGELLLRPQPLPVRGVPLTEVYAWEDPESGQVTVETPLLEVNINPWGGTVIVTERGGRVLLRQRRPSVGPPHSGWSQRPPRLALRWESGASGLAVTLEVPSETVPGVTIEKRLTIGAGPYLRCDYRLRNASAAELQVDLVQTTEAELSGEWTLPLPGGVLHEVAGCGELLVHGPLDLPRAASDYGEGWRAHSDGRCVVGLVWSAARQVDGLQWDLTAPPLPAGSTVDLPPLWLVAGRGDWELARDLWRRLYQDPPQREDTRPTLWEGLTAELGGSPAVVVGDTAPLDLRLRNALRRSWQGRWQLQGLVGEPPSAELTVAPGDRSTTTVTLRLPATPGVIAAAVEVQAAGSRRQIATPLVKLGPGGPATTRADGERWLLENGEFALAVAAGHLGAAVSLCWRGVELLDSTFPEPRPFLFTGRWFGGLHLYAEWPGADLWNQREVTVEPVQRTGAQGLAWSGLRSVGTCTAKDAGWLRLETDYLTVGGSPYLAVARRAVNTSGARQELSWGSVLWPRAGAAAVVHAATRRPPRQPHRALDDRAVTAHSRRAAGPGWQTGGQRWLSLELAPGVALSLVCGQPGGWCDVWHEEQLAAVCNHRTVLLPGEPVERVDWIHLTAQPDPVGRDELLGALIDLP